LAISKDKKVELVADYKEKLARSRGVVITGYRGLTVKDQEDLRKRLSDVQGVFQVVKNTLFERALEDAGLSVPGDVMAGPTALGYCLDDVPAVVKVLANVAKESEFLTLRGALLEGQFIAAQDVQALTELPSREVLLARLVGQMQAPIYGLVNVLAGTLRGLVTVLQARGSQLEGAAG
jgi:large subunit ribosomal protein L10